jgi:Flp pilus assembly protein TadG
MVDNLIGKSRRARGPRFLGAFAKDRRGVTSIEFAMISVPFLGLISAIFESAYVYMQETQLQAATQVAARDLQLSKVANSTTLNAFAQQNVCSRLTSLFNCNLLQVSVTTPSSWSAATTQEATSIYSTSYNGAQTISIPRSGSVAVLQVAYPLNQIVAILAGGVLMNGTITQIHAGEISQNGSWMNVIAGTYAFQVQ